MFAIYVSDRMHDCGYMSVNWSGCLDMSSRRLCYSVNISLPHVKLMVSMILNCNYTTLLCTHIVSCDYDLISSMCAKGDRLGGLDLLLCMIMGSLYKEFQQ